MFSAHLYARVRLCLRNLAHETAGAARTRHSLLPLFGGKENEFAKLGRNKMRREIAKVRRHSGAPRSGEPEIYNHKP